MLPTKNSRLQNPEMTTHPKNRDTDAALVHVVIQRDHEWSTKHTTDDEKKLISPHSDGHSLISTDAKPPPTLSFSLQEEQKNAIDEALGTHIFEWDLNVFQPKTSATLQDLDLGHHSGDPTLATGGSAVSSVYSQLLYASHLQRLVQFPPPSAPIPLEISSFIQKAALSSAILSPVAGVLSIILSLFYSSCRKEEQFNFERLSREGETLSKRADGLNKTSDSVLEAAEYQLIQKAIEKNTFEKIYCEGRKTAASCVVAQGVLTLTQSVMNSICAFSFLTIPTKTILSSAPMLVPALSIIGGTAGTIASILGFFVALGTCTTARMLKKNFCEWKQRTELFLKETTRIISMAGPENNDNGPVKTYKKFIKKSLADLEKKHKNLKNWSAYAAGFSGIGALVSVIGIILAIAALATSPAGWVLFSAAILFSLFFFISSIRSHLLHGQLSSFQNSDCLIDRSYLLRIDLILKDNPAITLNLRAVLHHSLTNRQECHRNLLKTAAETLPKNGLSTKKKKMAAWLALEKGQENFKKFVLNYCQAAIEYQEKKLAAQQYIEEILDKNKAAAEMNRGQSTADTPLLRSAKEIQEEKAAWEELENNLREVSRADSRHLVNLRALVRMAVEIGNTAEDNGRLNKAFLGVFNINPRRLSEEAIRGNIAEILLTTLPKQLNDTLQQLPAIEMQACKLRQDIPKHPLTSFDGPVQKNQQILDGGIQEGALVETA